jgi:hypothetical protein
MNPRVKRVKALDSYELELIFENDEKKIFNVKPFLEKGIFKELKNISFFKSVKVFMGSAKWPNNQDFCPDTLYEDSTKIS